MVNLFLKCPKQYRFRYDLGIILPPSAAQTVGTSVDAAVTRNLIQKKQTGQDLPLSDALDVYSTDFDCRKPETEWGDEDPGHQKDIGAQCLTAHHEKIAPKIQPETVQERFVIETDAGYNLGGTLDLVEVDGTIADTKTAKSAYEPEAVSRNIQASIYDFAFEATRKKKSGQFRFDVLIKPTKTLPARVQQVKAAVTERDREWLFETINQVHHAIEAGVDTPAPEGAWWCSPKWCGWWGRCKGRK